MMEKSRTSRAMSFAAAIAACVFAFAGCSAPAADASPSASETQAQETASAKTAAEETPEETPVESTEASAATPAAEESADDGGQNGLPTPDPMYETLTVMGLISDIDQEQDIIYVQGESGTGDAETPAEIGAVEAEDCMMLDAQTGAEVDDDILRPGDRVQVYVGLTMTRSIPPQAPCYALLTNLPDGPIDAHYVRALDVTQNEDGSVTVLSQNGDMLITVPADLSVEGFDENQTVPISSIQKGSSMIMWYGAATRDYPGQTTATRVLIDVVD